MVQVPLRTLRFDEFLWWSDGTDQSCELIDGVPMPLQAPNANHEDVLHHLWKQLDAHCTELQLPYVPPPMVVEVVSQNWRDDYIAKLAEYEDTEILEYWVPWCCITYWLVLDGVGLFIYRRSQRANNPNPPNVEKS